MNDFEFLERIRNKIAFRKLVSEQEQFNLIPFCVVDSKDLSKKVFYELFSEFGEPLVFQKEIASGGSGTYLVKKNNHNLLVKLATDKTQYIISKYLQNNTPLNTHLAIFANEILVFPTSVQIIEIENNCLLYKGGDYIAFNTLFNKYKTQVYNYANQLGHILQQNGFRGICGIDTLLDENGKLYLIEVNPRFQGSSNILDKALTEHGYDNLAKINYNAFQHNNTKHTNINLNNLNVNYSCYSLTNNNFGKQILKRGLLPKFRCSEYETDGLDVTQQIGEEAYLSKLIFNEPIFKKKITTLF